MADGGQHRARPLICVCYVFPAMAFSTGRVSTHPRWMGSGMHLSGGSQQARLCFPQTRQRFVKS